MDLFVQDINIPLLRKQRNSLFEARAEYQDIIDNCVVDDDKLVKRIEHFDGLINLCDHMLDIAEVIED